MNSTIARLDNRTALSLLKQVITGLDLSSHPTLELTPDLCQALAGHAEVPASAPSANAGELARAALQLLAADPELEPRILALAEEFPRQHFAIDPISLVAVTTLALCALQTQVDIAYDRKQGLRLRLKKKSASDALLKEFLKKLVPFLSHKTGKNDPA